MYSAFSQALSLKLRPRFPFQIRINIFSGIKQVNNFVNSLGLSIFVQHFSCFMTINDEKLLAEFEFRMRQLMYFCDMLKEENARMKQELEQKNTAMEVMSSELEELKARYDNLKFAGFFSSGNEKEKIEAKRRLSKLVRDVDKCITMLKA
jgi:cell division protein FtsB